MPRLTKIVATISSRNCSVAFIRSLFEAGEPGHPAMLARAIAGPDGGPAGWETAGLPDAASGDPLAEIRRINAINQANMQRMTQPARPPGALGSGRPQPPRSVGLPSPVVSAPRLPGTR